MKAFVSAGIVSLCIALCGPARAASHISIEEFVHVRLPDMEFDSVRPIRADAQKKLVAHLEVKGTIGGHIKFELLLPEDWNGGFVMGGGGGFVGSIQNMARDSVNKGYATVGTDTGHQSSPGYLATWALTNLEAQVNFGYLAVHRTTETAKALIRAYYGKDPANSYFLGCSRGGGQAMMESQRFPGDFDGIVAGAPAFHWTGLAASMVTIAKALYPDPAKFDSPVLTKEALQKLQAAILDQCDAQDGLKDGIIQDPSAAHFDLSKAGLTEAQRKAIEVIYQGARNDKGPIYPGFAPASECIPDQWIAWITGPSAQMLAVHHGPDLTFAFGTQIFKYLVFNNPDWDYSTYDFANFEKDTRVAASFLNATNPELDAMKARNGKLIIWHGWADPALPAQGTIDYYRAVLAHDPGAQAYCRLFLVPGCLHCGGGPGAAEVDWLGVIVDWVEHGKAPELIVASKHEGGKEVMNRPLFPYPAHASYKGKGDPNSAVSFEKSK
jgi:feruloyl esterase